MARIFITGSSQGLGLMAGQLLVAEGHEVVLHGRDPARAEAARKAAPGAAGAVVGDLSRLAEMRGVAEQADRHGRFDAVIHNVGVGYQEPRRIETEDGLPHVLAVNVLAPYVLTALMARPDRLVYLSSGLHRGAVPDFDDLLWTRRRWQGTQAYSESKFLDVLLAFAVARQWSDVLSNALEPGWVATRMGGRNATDDLGQGHLTQAWLATSDDPAARVTGGYFFHKAPRAPDPATRDEAAQDRLLKTCADLSGVRLPT
jgi:NAD(P)-dependent dehydrogenase (short-subunit alcohol dehydrogenase family)